MVKLWAFESHSHLLVTLLLSTLNYLQRLSEQQSDEELANIKIWLTQKTDNLVAGMEQSRQVTLKQIPYWR